MNPKPVLRLLPLCLLLSFGLVTFCNAQTKLSVKDFDNLVALAQLYSKNNMAKGEAFKKTADSLRTPILDHVVETLITIGKGDTTLLQKRFLQRPNSDDLRYFYVIREIHYNNSSENKNPLPASEVARKVLSESINENWLLDNYYYRLCSGMGMMFNQADISMRNINIDELGLKNETERSIAFLNITEALIHGRFRVLSYMKNNKRIDEFSRKMPMINDKPYYYFTSLSLSDFDWIGYQKTESYNTRHIGNFLELLLVHLSAEISVGDNTTARDIYRNSILSKPDYFKYSSQKQTLQELYDKSQK